MGLQFSAVHAAALCAQLPRESRVSRANNKANEWGSTEYLLARIEYDLQAVLMRGTKYEPRMMRTPADEERVDRMRARADKDKIADLLGIPEDRR